MVIFIVDINAEIITHSKWRLQKQARFASVLNLGTSLKGKNSPPEEANSSFKDVPYIMEDDITTLYDFH